MKYQGDPMMRAIKKSTNIALRFASHLVQPHCAFGKSNCALEWLACALNNINRALGGAK
jgi:hypothetical protein